MRGKNRNNGRKRFFSQIEKLKPEWLDAFKQMQNYYETESFKSFWIEYDASTWYQFKNPALIFRQNAK